jgi:hypothetical protein
MLKRNPRTAYLALAIGLSMVAAPTSGAQDAAAADEAASALVDDLRPLSLLAATAALYHDRTGLYPATAFELLGSREAERTGARALQLADLSIDQAGEFSYRVVVPDAGSMVERTVDVSMSHEPDSARHVAAFEILGRRDEDFGGGRRPLVRVDPLIVTVARGRLCLDDARMADLADASAFAAAAPYLGDRNALSVSFDTGAGRQVAAATLPR